MEAIGALFGGLILCTLAALLLRALFGNAPAGASGKVHQARTTNTATSYGQWDATIGEVDEDPFGRGNLIPNPPAPDSGELSRQDVNCYPRVAEDSTQPPTWAKGKVSDLVEQDPYAVGITDVHIVEPEFRKGR